MHGMGKTFRENLREELDYQDLTVKELSARTGIPKATLDCYLGARQTMPTADVAVKIAAELGVSVEYLVTGSDRRADSAGKKYKQILEDLKRLSPERLETVSIIVAALTPDGPKTARPF